MPGAATAHWAHVPCRAPVQKYMRSSSQCPQGAAHTSLSRDLAIKETLWFGPLWVQTTSAAWSSPAMWNCSTFQAPVSIAGYSWPQTAGKAKLAHLGLVFIGDVWELLLKFSLLWDIFCLIISLLIVCPPYCQAYLGKCARDTTLKPWGSMT